MWLFCFLSLKRLFHKRSWQTSLIIKFIFLYLTDFFIGIRTIVTNFIDNDQMRKSIVMNRQTGNHRLVRREREKKKERKNRKKKQNYGNIVRYTFIWLKYIGTFIEQSKREQRVKCKLTMILIFFICTNEFLSQTTTMIIEQISRRWRSRTSWIRIDFSFHRFTNRIIGQFFESMTWKKSSRYWLTLVSFSLSPDFVLKNIELQWETKTNVDKNTSDINDFQLLLFQGHTSTLMLSYHRNSLKRKNRSKKRQDIY